MSDRTGRLLSGASTSERELELRSGDYTHPKAFDDDRTDDQEEQKAKRRRYAWLLIAFGLGIGIALLGSFLWWRFKPSHKDHGGDEATPWKAADYEENWQHYENVASHPIEIEDNMRLSRLSQPALSPDGKTVVFARTQYEQTHLNRSATSLWVYHLPYTTGFDAKPLTQPIWGVHDGSLNWDGVSKTVFFLSNRDGDSTESAGSSSQIFQVTVPSATTIKATANVLSEPVAFLSGATKFFSMFAQQENEEVPTTGDASRTFDERLRANVPVEPRSRLATDPSLPTAAQADYTSVSQLTHYPVDVDNLLIGYTRDSTTTRAMLAFSARVYPNMSMQETADYAKVKGERGGDFLTFDKLFIRHWDEFMDGRRNHVFMVSVTQNSNGGVKATTDPIDLMKGVDSDAPVRPDGSAASEWAFSPSATKFAFTRQTFDPESKVAWNTNLDIYEVAVGGDFTPQLPSVCRTCSNLATDTMPRYSPLDDDVFAYRSTSVPGYESDRYTIKMMNGTADSEVDLTSDWKLSAGSIQWSADGQSLYVGVSDNARETIKLFNTQTRSVTTLLKDGSSSDVKVSGDGKFFVFAASSYDAPANIYIYNGADNIGELTTGFNQAVLAKLQQSATLEYNFTSDGNSQIQAWFWLPVGFDKTKKYPLAFLIHGGPQSAWESAWSYRWNPQIYAAAGYAVTMINFHGSGGWGQEFTDSIQGQYGGLPYHDLLNGLNYLLEESQWAANIDSTRMAALGASYGGYMTNWIAGHNWQHKYPFKALVVHDGMFNINSFYFETEEIFFPEHDIGGVPWLNATNYERWNPASPELVSKWNTPCMVIHGGKDYRIPETQGFGVFTALQRQGIPSKLLYLPKEAHQVFNTQNVIEWHAQVLAWIGKWTAEQ